MKAQGNFKKMIEVNSLWIGNSLSTLEVLALRSHIKVGHKVVLWTYGSVANIPDGVRVEDARQIMPESDVFAYQIGEGKGSWSACSNIFRYKLLMERDVWWVDTDVVALKPFDMSEYCVFASEWNREGFSSPTTCVIKMPQAVAHDCYKLALYLSADREKLQWSEIGPKLLSRIIWTWTFDDLLQYVLSPTIFCPVNWFDAEFDPPVHRDVDLAQSYAVHLWHEMWRRRGIDKDAVQESDCLYERLKSAILHSQ